MVDESSHPPAQEYEAKAMHPGLAGRTASGTLRFTHQRCIFEAHGSRVEMPLAGLRVHRGGYNNSCIFFQDPAQPDWSIYTSDEAALTDPALRHHPGFTPPAVAKVSRRSWWLIGFAAAATAFLLLFVGAILLLASQKDRLVRFLAFQIPPSWERNLGDSMLQQMELEGRVLRDSAKQERLEAIAAPLLAVVPDPGYSFQFHIVQNTNVNAFAIPGGHVVVFTGLLETAGQPEEIAGVLAHEIAHVTQRHGFRNIIESAGLLLLVQALVGDLGGILAVISESSQYLLRQKFSRDFEREADDQGWDYLLAAKIDPRGMIEFFKRLRALERQSPTWGADFLRTHPATTERIERLEKKWEALERKGDFLQLQEVR